MIVLQNVSKSFPCMVSKMKYTHFSELFVCNVTFTHILIYSDLFVYYFGDDMNDEGHFDFDKDTDETGKDVQYADETNVMDKFNRIQEYADEIINWRSVSLENPFLNESTVLLNLIDFSHSIVL